jgi:hypothetical protein
MVRRRTGSKSYSQFPRESFIHGRSTPVKNLHFSGSQSTNEPNSRFKSSGFSIPQTPPDGQVLLLRLGELRQSRIYFGFTIPTFATGAAEYCEASAGQPTAAVGPLARLAKHPTSAACLLVTLAKDRAAAVGLFGRLKRTQRAPLADLQDFKKTQRRPFGRLQNL